MSRKQSTVERIRKKKAAVPAPIERKEGVDPFHNGQTPTCRSLLHAVQDIFPELQQQMKQSTASSELGQLLRWHILKRRKERLFPPAPPLSVVDSPRDRNETLEETNNDSVAATTSKKKRKKKKKKKEAGDLADDLELTTSKSEEFYMGNNETVAVGNENRSSQQSKTFMASPTKADVSSEGRDPSNNKTRDSRFEPSVQSMDRSVHDLEEKRMILQKIITPDLQALPSDDLHAKDESYSSLQFLEQIQQESTEREEDESADLSVPLAPVDSSVGTPQGHHNRPRVRSRTLSSSSFASFEGVVTPTTANRTENSNDENGDQKLYMSSPVSHEWVPEEGSEAKTETPPGDVIKNPLELPYLRTLSRVNGLTTTTIDGSLISAEWADNHASDARLNSMETTKMLMDDWMGQLLEHGGDSNPAFNNDFSETDLSSFLNFLQRKLQHGTQPLGIPFSDLKNAVNEIDCGTCKGNALNVVENWSHRESTKPLVLNPIVFEDPYLQDASDVDTAFDYVALEEGHHLPKPDLPEEEDGVDVDKTVHWTFHIAEPNSKKNGTKHLFIDRITSKHVNSLVEYWLPCGIEEEILVGTAVSSWPRRSQSSEGTARPEILSRDQVVRLQRLVLEKEKMAKEFLEKIEQLGKEIRDELDVILSTLDPTRPNIEIVAYPKMKQVDEKCTELSDLILETIQFLTGGGSDALESHKLRLWTAYLEAMNKTIEACDKYYSQVGHEMADQSGALPVPFVSAAFRSLFQSLIEEKIRLWTDLGTFVGDSLTGRLLKELYTRTIWYSERAPSRPEKSQSLDDECFKIVKEMASLTITLRRGRFAEIVRERIAQTERMLEHLQAIVEPLAEEYASVEKYFSTERNLYFASLRSNIVLAHGVKKRMRLVDSSEVEGMATGVILMWTHIRLMQNRMINSSAIPPLPLQLKRWVLQDDNSLTESWHGYDDASPVNSYHQRYCQAGRQGKRRVMCVLAGLVYGWLGEQCKLWRAEMAEKELLTDFHFEGKNLSNVNPKETQASSKIAKSKKNKKKKTKNASTTNDEDSSRLEDSTSFSGNYSSSYLNGTVTPPPEISESEMLTEKMMTAFDILPQESLLEEQMEAEDPVTEITVDASLDSEERKSDFDYDNVESDNFLDKDSELEIFPCRIFVEDGDKMIAPEEFLVARMREIILESTKRDNIILIQ